MISACVPKIICTLPSPTRIIPATPNCLTTASETTDASFNVKRKRVISFYDTDEPRHKLFHFGQRALFSGRSAFLQELTICKTDLAYRKGLKQRDTLSHHWRLIRTFPNKRSEHSTQPINENQSKLQSNSFIRNKR